MQGATGVISFEVNLQECPVVYVVYRIQINTTCIIPFKNPKLSYINFKWGVSNV